MEAVKVLVTYKPIGGVTDSINSSCTRKRQQQQRPASHAEGQVPGLQRAQGIYIYITSHHITYYIRERSVTGVGKLSP
jgi:hypothetical protein